MTLSLFLMVLALVLLLCAAFGVNAGRVQLFPLGMAAWLLSIIIGGVNLIS